MEDTKVVQINLPLFKMMVKRCVSEALTGANHQEYDILTDAMSRAIERSCQPRGAMNRALEEMETRIERRIDNLFDRLRKELDNYLDKKMESHFKELDRKMQSQFEEMESRFKEMESGFEELNRHVRHLAEGMTTLTNNHDALGSRMVVGFKTLYRKVDMETKYIPVLQDLLTDSHRRHDRQDMANWHMETRSSIRTYNSFVTEVGKALVPMPTNDGDIPAEFPSTLQDFINLHPTSVDSMLVSYDVLSANELGLHSDELKKSNLAQFSFFGIQNNIWRRG
ncbi:hypothetical protein HDU96_009725 [Phlyctochytrium bullatum]|nr:hypothetical protein HDU96_009725 [Phlyctochytrium bullatum]